ncbi:3D domain-containing protein [Virgibacillus sp. 179-BFC.A HS]|uniref:3D domain-containing protein n=1 Tax=Tigheibacillus jepli TaxID=3035914 RepID=A0ABU5CCJ7_9BACI|nr:3D domain-containing protein [Virgibacillus sp. 179-BFC.A HS]MDY0404047.1 3D domain-containing protein [Virgibacillus sp. 179-BFC.A HS]
MDQKAKPGKQLNITNVAYETVEKTQRVPFQVVTKYDDNLEKGKQLVKQEGEDGKLRKIYQVTKENNKKVKEKYVKTISEQEVKHKIIVIGTKEPEAAVATSPQKSKKQTKTDNKLASQPAPVGSKPEKSGKTLRMVASAYTGDCSGCSGYTATGINLKANPNAKVIAVDPNVIPLGTRVWVEGYGTAIAGDTGGAIHGNRIDLHVPSVSAAHAFGTRTVTVKILD